MDRAISYRLHQGFSHDDMALSVGVQIMARLQRALAFCLIVKGQYLSLSDGAQLSPRTEHRATVFEACGVAAVDRCVAT